jgi:hypothetical protein
MRRSPNGYAALVGLLLMSVLPVQRTAWQPRQVIGVPILDAVSNAVLFLFHSRLGGLAALICFFSGLWLIVVGATRRLTPHEEPADKPQP